MVHKSTKIPQEKQYIGGRTNSINLIGKTGRG
nr:MAG TPA: hypothetical protein [Caudoviricetes sp.]